MLLKNKSGFSLLEMVIAMGLATGLLVFYMKMQGEQTKKAYTAKVNTEVETFFSDFKGTIARNGFCSKSFESLSLSDNSETKIDSIKNLNGDIRYKVGDMYGAKTVKLTGITLKDFKPDDQAGLEGIATIQVDMEKIGNIYGSKIINKTMEVSVTRDGARNILHCGSLSSSGTTNININPPQVNPANPNTPAIQGTDPAINANNQAQTPSQTTSSSSTSQSDSDTQKAIQAELEKNPDFKSLQENLKKLQEQQKEIENL